ncbi:hypothetical protein MOQ_005611 [Trypanosoma cruzi marinkellei]|uniref:Uncharacterized protein n=1 Tax=Trypanosoma cruzi marinkellei TaxID=85056 RepID=K2MU54_TRYCR|nr:hypothetical protein MOQ_005611 [Trypanosoma cruzi marinkellei]
MARGARGFLSQAPAQPPRHSVNVHARSATSLRYQKQQQVNKPRPVQPHRRFSWRTLPPIAWLIDNAMPIAIYQLFLEAGCTGVCAWLLLHDRVTTAGIEACLHRYHYPFTGLVNWEGGRHKEGWKVAGCRIGADTLTALHTGHNIANGLLPLQVVVLALTYPVVARAFALAAQGPLATRLLRVKERLTVKSVHDRVEVATPHPFGKPKQHRRR